MGKQILVMTGSPRKGGNSDRMADAFVRGAQAAGHTVDKFQAAFHNIGGCKACNTCWSKGVPCSFDDDFNTKLAPLLERAEVIVFAAPLYFYTFPAQIKGPMDRIYAYAGAKAKTKLKISESALIMPCGDDTVESCAGAVESFRLVSKFCGWTNRGELLAPGLMSNADVEKADYLEQAKAFGKGI